MSQNYFDFDPDPAYYHPNSYRPEFHTQPKELDQPIQELTDEEEDDAIMSQLEDICGC